MSSETICSSAKSYKLILLSFYIPNLNPWCELHYNTHIVSYPTSNHVPTFHYELQVKAANNLEKVSGRHEAIQRAGLASGSSCFNLMKAISFLRSTRGPMPKTKLAASISMAFSVFSSQCSGLEAFGFGLCMSSSYCTLERIGWIGAIIKG